MVNNIEKNFVVLVIFVNVSGIDNNRNIVLSGQPLRLIITNILYGVTPSFLESDTYFLN